MNRITIHNAVDVVIPMRNGARTILAAIASVSAQTRRPRKIIVVDDGSDDGGAELIRENPLVEIIATPPMGVSHARNTGIRAARAEFIAILDCDDLWQPDKLELQLAVMESDPATAVVTCDQVNIRVTGEMVPRTLHRPRFRGRAYQELLTAVLRLGGWSSSLVFKRSSFLEAGGYDEALDFCEDLDFCLRLARAHRFDYCPQLLTFVVENPDSTTRRPSRLAETREIHLQSLTVMERQLEWTDSCLRIAMPSAQVILFHILHDRVGWSGIVALRSQLQQRTPRLAALIARGNARFILSLIVLSMPRIPGALRFLWRNWRNRIAPTVPTTSHATWTGTCSDEISLAPPAPI